MAQDLLPAPANIGDLDWTGALSPIVQKAIGAWNVLGSKDQISSYPQEGLAPSPEQALSSVIPKDKWDLLMMAAPVTGASLIKAAPRAMAAMRGVEATEAPTPAPTYFSNVKAAFEDPRVPGTLSRDQAMALLRGPGVKAEEVKWLGLEDKLRKGPARVQKQDILNHIADNQIDVEENVKYPTVSDKPVFQITYQKHPIPEEWYQAWKAKQFDEGRLEVSPGDDGRLVYRFSNLPDDPMQFYPYLFASENGLRQHVLSLEDMNPSGVKVPGLDFDPHTAPDVLDKQEFTDPREANDFMDRLRLEHPGHAPRIDRFTKPSPDAAKYNDPRYNLPGGDNYREVLLKWANPPQEEGDSGIHHVVAGDNDIIQRTFTTRQAAEDYAMAMNTQANGIGDLHRVYSQTDYSKPTNYQSSHWTSDPNVLAHMRLDDRLTPDGKRMLFAQEFQSDWQNEMKKEQNVQLDPTKEWDYVASQILREQGKDHLAPLSLSAVERAKNIAAEGGYAESTSRIPDAPLVRNYHELVMKRLLRMAAEGGYEGVGWTTGDTQAKRWSGMLHDNVKYAEYNPENANLRIEKPNGEVHDLNVELSELPDQVGRDNAEKLLRAAHEGLDGQNMVVGERGFQHLYDKLMPKEATKHGRKFGVGHEILELPAIPPNTFKYYPNPAALTKLLPKTKPIQIHYMATPRDLRESLLRTGLPLFATAGAAAGLAAQQAKDRNRSEGNAAPPFVIR